MKRAKRRAQRLALDWSELQTFAAVAGCGAVAAAARQLGVNRSTVLRRVAALERALGVRLIELAAGGYVVTAAGRELLSGTLGLAERIAAAREQVARSDDAIEGEIRLTSTDTLVHGMLMPLVERFVSTHPRVRVHVSVNNTFLSLTRREADVAVRGTNVPPENLVGRRVGNIRTAPFASRSYLEMCSKRQRLTDLDWIAPDESLAHLEQAKWLARTISPDRVVMTVDSLVGMVHAVQQGVGAAMLLCPLADARADLVRLAKPDASLDTQIWVLTHPQLRNVARVRAFSQFLFDALSADHRLSHA